MTLSYIDTILMEDKFSFYKMHMLTMIRLLWELIILPYSPSSLRRQKAVVMRGNNLFAVRPNFKDKYRDREFMHAVFLIH